MAAANSGSVNRGKPLEKPSCKLLGTDGNVFALLSRVSDCLRRNGQGVRIAGLRTKVMNSGSYDEALQIMMEYVDIE